MSDTMSFAEWLDESKPHWEEEMLKIWNEGKRKQLELEESRKLEEARKADRENLEGMIQAEKAKIEHQAQAESWPDEYLENYLTDFEDNAEEKRKELDEKEEEDAAKFKSYLSERWEEYKSEHREEALELIETLWPEWRARMIEK